jgi:hypothetical protein
MYPQIKAYDIPRYQNLQQRGAQRLKALDLIAGNTQQRNMPVARATSSNSI